VDRTLLAPGSTFNGPALVVEYSTTTVVPPGYSARMDAFGNLILERRHE
jgi:N-methylhydantoinase A